MAGVGRAEQASPAAAAAAAAATAAAAALLVRSCLLFERSSAAEWLLTSGLSRWVFTAGMGTLISSVSQPYATGEHLMMVCRGTFR